MSQLNFYLRSLPLLFILLSLSSAAVRVVSALSSLFVSDSWVDTELEQSCPANSLAIVSREQS